MNDNVLNAQERGSGKSELKLLRKQKLVPGIFYTSQEQSVPIALAEVELNKLLAHKPALILLKMPDGNDRECVVRAVQRDPLWGNILHIDFMGITRGQKVTLTVPVRLLGTPEGVKEGGILEHTLRELEIECMPRHIPSHLEWDVSSMVVGDSVRVEELEYDNIVILTDPSSSLATVVPPRVEVEPVVEAEEELEEEVEGEEAPEEGEEPSEKSEES